MHGVCCHCTGLDHGILNIYHKIICSTSTGSVC